MANIKHLKKYIRRSTRTALEETIYTAALNTLKGAEATYRREIEAHRRLINALQHYIKNPEPYCSDSMMATRRTNLRALGARQAINKAGLKEVQRYYNEMFNSDEV